MRTAIGISVLAVAACLCALLLTVRSTVAAIPGEIADTRAELLDQVAALRIDAFQEIDSQATGIRGDVKMSTASLLSQVERIRETADAQLTGARADLRYTIAESVTAVVAPIAGIRTDLQPVLTNSAALTANAAALTKDAQDSWDDSYEDVRGLLQSSTVAATQIAQTAATVRAATPQFLATAQETNRQFAGISADVHAFTTKFTAPASLRTKIWDGFKSMALIASHF